MEVSETLTSPGNEGSHWLRRFLTNVDEGLEGIEASGIGSLAISLLELGENLFWIRGRCGNRAKFWGNMTADFTQSLIPID